MKRPGSVRGLVALSLVALLVGGLAVGWVAGPLGVMGGSKPARC